MSVYSPAPAGRHVLLHLVTSFVSILCVAASSLTDQATLGHRLSRFRVDLLSASFVGDFGARCEKLVFNFM